MTGQATLFNVMAIATWILQAAIVARMLRTKLSREYQVFFAYTAFTLVQGLFQAAVRIYFGFRSPHYFLVYWVLFPVQITLLFFVIQEIYSKVLYRYEGLRALSSMLFRWAFMVLVVIAITTALASRSADNDWMYNSILKVDYSTRIVEFGLIALLFFLARTLALGWRECIFGIAVGTCFYCSTELAGVSLRAHFGNDAANLIAALEPLFGVFTLAIWAAYLYKAERKELKLGPPNPLLEEWNEAVLQFLNR